MASEILLDETTTIAVDNVETYTINVYRLTEPKSIDKTLRALQLRAGADAENSETDLVIAFMGDTFKYNATVRHDIEKVTLVATADDAGAIVQVGGVRYNQFITSRNIDLNGKGSKTEIRLTVTPEDGTSSASYTITVYRERATLSSDNNLRNLSLGSGITLMPSFSSSKIAYTARVRNSIDHATVTRTLSDQAGGAGYRVTKTFNDIITPETGNVDEDPDASGLQVNLNCRRRDHHNRNGYGGGRQPEGLHGCRVP